MTNKEIKDCLIQFFLLRELYAKEEFEAFCLRCKEQYEDFVKKEATIEEVCIIARINSDLTRFCKEEKVFFEKLFELIDECDKINENV